MVFDLLLFDILVFKVPLVELSRIYLIVTILHVLLTSFLCADAT